MLFEAVFRIEASEVNWLSIYLDKLDCLGDNGGTLCLGGIALSRASMLA